MYVVSHVRPSASRSGHSDTQSALLNAAASIAQSACSGGGGDGGASAEHSQIASLDSNRVLHSIEYSTRHEPPYSSQAPVQVRPIDAQ